MSTCQLISCSLRNRILDSVSRLTYRKQVPAEVTSLLISGGIDPRIGPPLEDMKRLLVDAFHMFDRENTTIADVPSGKSHGLSSNVFPKVLSNISAADSVC